MNQKTLLFCCGAVLLFFAFNAAKAEYVRVTLRIELTQAKVDALTDELKATTKTVHDAIRSITDRFKQMEETQAASKASETNETVKTVESPKQLQPTIVMHSGYSCGPCNAWLATEKAKWESSGWSVQVVKEAESKRLWPWFEITERDGKRFEVDGPLTNDSFLAAKKAK